MISPRISTISGVQKKRSEPISITLTQTCASSHLSSFHKKKKKSWPHIKILIAKKLLASIVNHLPDEQTGLNRVFSTQQHRQRAKRLF